MAKTVWKERIYLFGNNRGADWLNNLHDYKIL